MDDRSKDISPRAESLCLSSCAHTAEMQSETLMRVCLCVVCVCSSSAVFCSLAAFHF